MAKEKLYAGWVGRGGAFFSHAVRVKPGRTSGALWAPNGNDSVPASGPGIYVDAVTGVTSLVSTSKREVDTFLLGAAAQRDVLAGLFRVPTPTYEEAERAEG